MSKIANPTKVITGVNTRWSYANVWDPKSINGAAPKYSVSLLSYISIIINTHHIWIEAKNIFIPDSIT